MVRVSIAIVLAALTASPAFAAPVVLSLETRRLEGIEARAPHFQQTTRDCNQFDIEVRASEDPNRKENAKKYLDKTQSFRVPEPMKGKGVRYKDEIISIKEYKKSQPKSKKGNQRRSIGLPSSFQPVIRSTAPSYIGARRSFVEDDFALETRHRRRENSRDFLEKDSMFEAREIDEID
ncbi:hypothetical protein BKA70DRAFT_1413646 [Coprinopsis sp. MPI-PUGE-AT-0042]|nr:hypothetical protein BKA70DRAFT_1413646 [Coprinopsis sp. MPI-PUGE-AT-0042]